MTIDPTVLPPERLGALMRQARRTAGLSRRRAANMAAITPGKLIAYERGWERADRLIVDTLNDVFGITMDQLIPPRKTVVFSSTQLSSGAVTVATSSPARDDVLRGLVELVREARAAKRESQLQFRQSDLEILVGVLDTDESVLATRIIAILGCDESEATAISGLLRTLAGPLLGAAFSVAVIGGSAVASNTSGASLQPAVHGSPTVQLVAAQTDIGALSTDGTARETARETAGAAAGAAATAPTAAVAPIEAVSKVTTVHHATAVQSGAVAQPTPTPQTGTQSAQKSTAAAKHHSLPKPPDTGILPGEHPTTILHNL